MKDQHDENLEIIADELREVEQDHGYIKYLRDENIMIADNINKMEQILSSGLKAHRMAAMFFIC